MRTGYYTQDCCVRLCTNALHKESGCQYHLMHGQQYVSQSSWGPNWIDVVMCQGAEERVLYVKWYTGKPKAMNASWGAKSDECQFWDNCVSEVLFATIVETS